MEEKEVVESEAKAEVSVQEQKRIQKEEAGIVTGKRNNKTRQY